MPSKGALFFLVFASLVSGCAASYRVGAGANSSIPQAAGAHAAVGGGVGIELSEGWVFEESLELRAGLEGPPVAALVDPVAGMDLVRLPDDDRLGFRVGLRGALHIVSAQMPRIYTGPGLAVAILKPLAHTSSSRASAAFELSFFLMADISETPTGPDALPFLALTVFYERRVVGNPLDGMFEKH